MNKRTGVMFARPFEQRLLDRMPEAVIVQPKLNGVRFRAVPATSGYTLYSSEGNEIVSIPHINEQLNSVFDKSRLESQPPILDGELYIHGVLPQDIRSITSRTTNLHDAFATVEAWVFDEISELTQTHRAEELRALTTPFAGTDSLRILPSHGVRKSEIGDLLSYFLGEGYEGVVIRNPRSHYELGKKSCILKLKPRNKDNYQITGAFEAVDKHGQLKGMLGGLHLVDVLGNRFNCGAGTLTHKERQLLWESHFWEAGVGGWWAQIKYPELSKRGVPLQAILVSVKNVRTNGG